MSSIELMFNQRRIFEQSDDFSPDNLIQELLAYEATVVAHGTTELSPAIGANAFVVMKLTRS